ncbi:MAG: hypothetical protein A2086_14055 [Spirochaetes bacterium GWD1_27_9]|nr:MAG: hypothetical protein A2Z98_02560 [Spirochaetes bacterium GWB1_27_13]OHD22608.1 MAG: hypothetical protein A2Y34_07525 [Spirochaetes bacterium GWC1_27_15]OHD35233.1 MAG: hypothetical protein A2086_14055 [Spirochaetes bacterium GWD1_27_9]
MKKRISFLFILVTLLFTFNCTQPNSDGGASAGQTVTTTVPYVALNGVIVDSATNQPINQAINVTFSGQDKSIAEKFSGAVNGVLKVNTGIVSFNIEKEILSTLDFTVVVNADKYISSSKRINSITSSGKLDFQVSLVNIEKTPQGVNVVQKSIGTADTSGKTVSDASLSTNTNESVSSQASITLLKDTIVKDASGDILTGSLKATVGYFSPTSENALSSFPGGLGNVNITTTRGDTEENGFFVSGGFVSIDITDQNGKSAEKFEGNSLKVSVDIPEGLLNPETGVLIKAGDVIPLWSYNKETGKWTKETTVTRSSNGVEKINGKLTLSFDAPHLSYWNIDWFSPSKIDTSRNIKLIGIEKGVPVKIDLYSPGYGYKKSLQITNSDTNQFMNVPNFAMNVIIYDMKGVEIGRATKVNLGDSGDLEITVISNSTSNDLDIMKLSGKWDVTTDSKKYEITLDSDKKTFEQYIYSTSNKINGVKGTFTNNGDVLTFNITDIFNPSTTTWVSSGDFYNNVLKDYYGNVKNFNVQVVLKDGYFIAKYDLDKDGIYNEASELILIYSYKSLVISESDPYQISFKLGTDLINANLYCPPVNTILYDANISDYAKNYFDNLKSSGYNGPYTEFSKSSNGINFYLYNIAKSETTSYNYYVITQYSYYQTSGGIYILIYKTDKNGNLIESYVGYTNSSYPLTNKSSYVKDEDCALSFDKPIILTRQTQTRSISLNNGKEFVEEFKKIIESSQQQIRTRAISNEIILTNLKLKSKVARVLSSYKTDTPSLQINTNYISNLGSLLEGIGTDSTLKISFQRYSYNSSNEKKIAMDKTITDIYVNNQKVQGSWIEDASNDGVYTLTYKPVGGWTPNSAILIDIPEIHKSQSGEPLLTPYFAVIKTVSTSIDVAQDLYVSKSDYDYINVGWKSYNFNNNIKFEVYRSETENGTYTKVSGNMSSGYLQNDNDIRWGISSGYTYFYFYDKTYTEEKTYFYKIKAINISKIDEYTETKSKGIYVPKTSSLTLGSYSNYEVDTTTIPNTNTNIEKWFTLDTEIGKTYLIYTDSADEGSGLYNGKIRISGYYKSSYSDYLSTIFSEYSPKFYRTPYVIEAQTNKLYIRVGLYAYNNNLKYNYAIKVVKNVEISPPYNILATTNTDSIKLSWDATNDCDTTYIYKSVGGSPILLGKTTTKDFTDTEVVSGITYIYKIISKKGDYYSKQVNFEKLFINDTNTTPISIGSTNIITDRSYYDNYQSIVYSLQTETGKNYAINITSNSYQNYYLYDSNGKQISNIYSSYSLLGDGKKYYIVTKSFNKGVSITFNILTGSLTIDTSGISNIVITVDSVDDTLFILGSELVMKAIDSINAKLSPVNFSRYSLPLTKGTTTNGITKSIFTFSKSITATDVWHSPEIRFEICSNDPTTVTTSDWAGLGRLDWEKLQPGLKDNPYVIKENLDYFQIRFNLTNTANDYKPAK